MRISFSSQQYVRPVSLRHSSNSSFIKNSNDNNGRTEKNNTMNKSSMAVSLGQKSKKNNMLENLIERKVNLMDRKNDIIEKALENGESPSATKEKLHDINKQINEINEQISKIQCEEQRKSLGTEDVSKKKEKLKEKSNKLSAKESNGDNSEEKMTSVLSLSNNLSQAKALSSQRTSMSGEVRVLENEIKLDESRGIETIEKRKSVAKIKENIENITEKINDKLTDTNNKFENSVGSNRLNNITYKSEESKNTSNNDNTQNDDKLLIKQQQTAQNIKHYSENINDKDKYEGEKIDAIA
ncbi:MULTISPECIES: hypothetical protein [unclassified Clostridium]|uniref:hypothetical protein n=1 Tax=unclassified Clostridium TaxID=2614128 RepID=UPI0025BF4429|nr:MULTISPECIES: hypothetical protein [unclassified Clostridium]